MLVVTELVFTALLNLYAIIILIKNSIYSETSYSWCPILSDPLYLAILFSKLYGPGKASSLAY